MIIPFHSIHAHCLRDCVESLAVQTVPQCEYEVILVNAEGDGSVRSIVKTISDHAEETFNFRYMETKKGGRALARNAGVKEARANLLLFFASDFIASSQLVDHHLRLHKENPDDRIVGIGPARFAPKLQITPFMQWLDETGESYGCRFSSNGAKLPADFFYGGNTSIRLNFLASVGGFNETLPYHAVDDYEMGRRLLQHGMITRYLPEALAYHDHQYPMSQRRLALTESGESSAIAELKNPNLAVADKFHEASKWPVVLLGLRAVWFRGKYFLFRRKMDLWNYFDFSMRQAWVGAYKKAKRSLQQSHV